MQKKSLIKQNILRYINQEGLTRYQFYKKTGITRGILDQDNGLSEENTAKFLAHFPTVSAEWLITGKGPMLKKESYLDSGTVSFGKKEEGVPFYSTNTTDNFIELLQGSILDRPKPYSYITIPHLPNCDGAISVIGDSMHPLLKSGDIALYKHVNDTRNIIWGEMYLIAIDHEGDQFFFAKYVQKSDESNRIRLISNNLQHQPLEFPMHSIKGLALIKATIRFNTGF